MRSFIPNRSFAEELREDDDYLPGLQSIAEAAVPQVDAAVRQAGGPWVPRTGHAPVEVQESEGHILIVLTDHAGHLMEFGSAKSPVIAPLRRGVSAAGLRIDGESEA